ncbi:MAG TPA: hypothetical protein VFO41_06715 [Alphaproteobacteria bacterium]|nr:hypothetical protein [Alphaproteobacteria bacterium]
MTSSKTNASAAPSEAEAFYAESLKQLKLSGIEFLLAGTYAVNAYTGLNRPTKDLDVFCRAGDYPRILAHFQKQGYEIEVQDERWLAKVRQGELFFDVIFSMTCAVAPITDQWFAELHRARVYDIAVPIVSPTELIWSKAFVQGRTRYDGADVAHVILKQHENIDWRRLLSHMEQYWEVLLVHVLNFRFVYPTERECIPRWLFDELVTRLKEHADLPVPQVRVSRGRLFSGSDYLIDVMEWGFTDVVGEGGRH